MTKLSSSLPKGDANGLGALARHLIDLHRKGRKSAWVHDLMQIHDTEMSKR